MSKVNYRRSPKKYKSCHTPKSHMRNYDLLWNDGLYIGGLDKHDEKIRFRRKRRHKENKILES